ncbi:N-acetyltransferase [Azotobacter chroococcum subsp. isscasi]|uniref:GNAT family N-acetyltransferase n=1 Tax=Azotobacter chroococcum TaxID=353 RepID=UPI00103D8775|nr:GNAT family N-acetyltransferase [Azotobacter chroococcum]TBW11966.1 N-acetyltransferase [Azotobacter chroococcum subsp. isscasi]
MIRTERLGKDTPRSGFDCGDAALDNFISRYALQQQSRQLSRCYVALSREGRLAGFYTLSAASIAFEELPEDLGKRLPRYPLPAIRLGRFAVAREYQGQGLGRDMLAHALRRAVEAADIVGIAFVLVDAKHEHAARFYRRLGFVPLLERPLTLVLPLATLAQAL